MATMSRSLQGVTHTVRPVFVNCVQRRVERRRRRQVPRWWLLCAAVHAREMKPCHLAAISRNVRRPRALSIPSTLPKVN